MIQHRGTQTIHTDRLTLRRLTVADSEDVFEKWAGSYENSQFVMKCPHDNLTQTEQMISGYAANYSNPDFYMWGIVFEDTLIGYICGNEINQEIQSICIGYCITKACWNNGIATEAARAVIDYFFSLGFNRVFSYHNPLNPASGRVMQKCGMKFEGRIRGGSLFAGEICDCLQYSILKADNTFLEIAYLADHPEHIQTCASWIYGLWACQSGAPYELVLDKFTKGANKETLPLTLIALYHSKPAGTVSLWKTDATRNDLTPWLAALYVHPFYRNKKISVALIDRLTAEAGRLGLTELYLVTEEAKGLYSRFGWAEIEQVTTPYGEASLMKKCLG
jgi:ribosomal-protein-alanine N-acetyltransferase